MSPTESALFGAIFTLAGMLVGGGIVLALFHFGRRP